jgi:hypothetical protein
MRRARAEDLRGPRHCAHPARHFEAREHSVAGVVYSPATVLLQQPVDDLVVRVESAAPLRTIRCTQRLGRSDDIGEKTVASTRFPCGSGPFAEVEDLRGERVNEIEGGLWAGRKRHKPSARYACGESSRCLERHHSVARPRRYKSRDGHAVHVLPHIVAHAVAPEQCRHPGAGK